MEAKSDQEEIVPSGDELSHNSHSLSEERTVSASPRNNIEVTRHTIGREESPESESWIAIKVPKLISSMPNGQTTEATMRKARVSVRARSEAPLVHHFTIAL